MSKAKPTPGPWIVFGEAQNIIGWKLGGERVSNGVVARVFGGRTVDVLSLGHETNDRDIMRANARLIAAAPELYGACHDAIRYLFNERGAWGVDEPEAELYRTLVNVTAKAEGRE